MTGGKGFYLGSRTSLGGWIVRVGRRAAGSAAAVAMVICVSAGLAPAAGQTLDQTLENLLSNNCANLFGQRAGGSEGEDIGDELAALCNGPGGAGTSAGGTSAVTPSTSSSVAVQRAASQRQQNGGGSSGDLSTLLGGGLSLFMSADVTDLDKDITTFEDGLKALSTGGAIGADLAINDQTFVGIGFKYARVSGDFSGGGEIESDSYGMFAYVSLTPMPGLFVDIAGSYDYKTLNSRRAVAFSAGGVTLSGDTQGETDGDEIGFDLRGGYDFFFGNVTVGPRWGMSFKRTKIEGYAETGTTGLELNVRNQVERSLQSRLGAYGSMAISTSFGVLVPYASVDYIHEFQDDQRTITATLVQDLSPTPALVQFQNEPPDRNFFDLGLGMSAVLANGLQPYAKVSATVGHSYLDTYGGSVGVRITF